MVMAMEAPCKKSAKGVLLTPSSSSSCFITDLPIAIHMEILSRVPLKTLAACKSVCKLWLHLITDPHFCLLHHTRAPPEVFFRKYHDQDTIKLHTGNFSNFDVKLNTLFEFPKFSVRSNNAVNYRATKGAFSFANSCNGLLCYYGASAAHRLAVNRFAVVWNPCTRELITFPAPKLDKVMFYCCGYGLGFSIKANKYKLLRVVARKEFGPSADGFVGEISTIENSCSWKTVGPCSSAVWKPIWGKDRLCGTFLQGTLHWACSSNSNKSDVTVHTFDFEDDQFGRLPLPPSYVNKNRWYVGTLALEALGVLSGCLFISDCRDEGVTIWLMKEYGVQDSWTNLFCVPHPLGSICYQCCLPLTYMDNGEILMKCINNAYFTNVFFYNPDLKSVRHIGSVPYFSRVIAYRPSLVQLKDSMPGHDVHVMKPRCADLKQSDPDWWEPVKEKSPQQHSSETPQTAKPTVGRETAR